jgi:hypothetical protein
MKTESKSNREHSFDVELASIVGLEKSIILKNIEYWVLENERRKQQQYFSNGVWWTEESLTSLAKKYPYMKKASIGRWMQELQSDGWTVSVIAQSGVCRYSVGNVFMEWNIGGNWQALIPVSQNETAKRYPKLRQEASQNETVAVPKWDGSCPKMRHTNIELDVDLDIDLNVEADKPQPAPKNEIKIEPNLNEDPKKPNNFTGRGAAKKEKPYAPHIHAENEQHFEYFSDPGKAKAAWAEWIEYKHTQHREKYKEAKSELAKLRQLFQQFNGDSKKFEDAVNYSIGNLYKGIFAPKIENGNGKFQHLDKAQQQHVRMARFVADIHNGTAFADAGKMDIITGD